MRLTRFAALAKDLYYPVRGTATVNGSSGRTVNYLNAFDIVGIDISNTIGSGLDAASLRIGIYIDHIGRAVIDNNSIHNVKRLGAAEDRTHTTETHRESTRRIAGVLRYLSTHYATIQNTTQILSTGILHLAGVDGRDGITQLFLSSSYGSTGYDHLI